jgi:hypothetical protein
MAATVQLNTAGRSAPIVDAALIPITINGNGVTYTSGTGLPFDLAGVLNTANPNDSENIIQPVDIIGILPGAISTNGFLAADLVIGTPTQQTAVGSGYGSAAGLPAPMTVRPDYIWATCPATIRLFATGASSNAALGEFATGANSDTVTVFLIYARNGSNT